MLFDSASGDFWVLDYPTRELLVWVESSPRVTMADMLSGGHWNPHTLSEAVDALVNAEVLVQEADLAVQIVD